MATRHKRRLLPCDFGGLYFYIVGYQRHIRSLERLGNDGLQIIHALLRRIYFVDGLLRCCADGNTVEREWYFFLPRFFHLGGDDVTDFLGGCWLADAELNGRTTGEINIKDAPTPAI